MTGPVGGIMLTPAESYADLVAGFRWQVPDFYNIAADVCDRWAAADPDRIALIDRRTDATVVEISYRTLREKSDRLANAFAALGVARGDRVAILLPQMPETLYSHLATYKLAAIALPLASLFGVDALEHRLGNAGAKAIVTDRAGLEKIAAIRDRLPELQVLVTVDDPSCAPFAGVHGFDPLLERSAGQFETTVTKADDPALMIYTSGTTGLAKGALHAHRVLLGHLPGVEMPHEFLPQPGDRFWTPADWAWAGGLLNVLLPSLHFGIPVVAYRAAKFDPEEALALMGEMRVRNAFIPPTALKILRTVERPRERFGLAIRSIGSGGEALGREVYEWAQEGLGLTINEFYGQTECNLVLSSCARIGVSRPGAIGKPVPGHEVAIIGADGEALPAGEKGQIAVRRPDPVMFLEYWKRPEATEQKFAGDWMLTGDQGVMDADGYFHFVGRDDDVITSAGYRIGPGEIEDCLIAHPAVALAAVVGKPDPVRTEIVKAYIVLKEDAEPSPELAEAIRLYVRDRLAAHEYPREVEFVEDLPMTTTGKVIRRILRDRARGEAG
ncbi:acetyl-CoA synthetase [Breoghania corrubedonensis]|uniref:Acetyl-CoA synthetase n=2 Tax=Breoghania corrubedonensis TaxID=665038 RepID=A0A2T5VIF6_9HYPH|nr:acetyl-CoA synthetase [Breoghania corrubedonensis]